MIRQVNPIILLTIVLCSFSIVAQETSQNSDQKTAANQAEQPIRESNPGVRVNSRGVIQLQDTIRGSREQPKVLSIVPWQPPKDKEQLPSPFVKRIEQDFLPLDREEFKRKVQHFERLASDNSGDDKAN